MLTKPPNEFEHCQNVFLKVYNKKVKAAFKEEIPDDDISTSEGSLKYACLIKDSDSAIMMALRGILFYCVRGEIANELGDRFFGVPKTNFNESFVYKPQVIFTFRETTAAAKAAKRYPKYMRLSYRVMKDEESITKSFSESLTTKIKAEFPTTFVHSIGKKKCSYYEPEKGLQLIISASTNTEGETLAKKICDLVGTTFKPENFSVGEKKFYPPKKTKTIMGQKVNLPVKGVVTQMKLQRVDLSIHGGLNRTTLLYRTEI